MPQNSESTIKEYERRIFEAMNFISKHNVNNPSLEDIAQVAHFSKFHFHRIFKLFAHETVADFTRRIRLERAASLLCYNPDRSITEIAFECNFSSSQNFAKQFNKQFGLSPTCFRQNYSEQKNSDAKKQYFITTIDEKGIPQPGKFLIPQDKDKLQSMNVTLQSRSSFEIAYIRFIAPYQTESTQKGLTKLVEILRVHQIEFSSIIGIAWDNPEITLPGKCRYDLGVIITPDQTIPDVLGVQLIPGGDYAVYHCKVSENDLEKPWDDIVKHWLPYSGYMPSGTPGYEIFGCIRVSQIG